MIDEILKEIDDALKQKNDRIAYLEWENSKLEKEIIELTKTIENMKVEKGKQDGKEL